jgi:single-strand DNA-binding protein
MINKVILVGNLGDEPIIRYTGDGKAIANLRVATSESWTDKSTGQKQERTEWHRVSVFDKLAEVCQKYLHKGSKVFLEGKLQTRSWDNNGVQQYSTEVILSGWNSTLMMLDKKGEPVEPSDENAEQPKIEPVPADDFEDEDIPF